MRWISHRYFFPWQPLAFWMQYPCYAQERECIDQFFLPCNFYSLLIGLCLLSSGTRISVHHNIKRGCIPIQWNQRAARDGIRNNCWKNRHWCKYWGQHEHPPWQLTAIHEDLALTFGKSFYPKFTKKKKDPERIHLLAEMDARLGTESLIEICDHTAQLFSQYPEEKEFVLPPLSSIEVIQPYKLWSSSIIKEILFCITFFADRLASHILDI